MQGIIGRKLGMTQVYDSGERVPVTVIEAGPCTVLQRKTTAHDGYEAVQVGFADAKASRLTKPEMGLFKKTSLSPKKFRREFRVGSDEASKVGDVVTVRVLEGATHVDVVSMSKGRGFQGVVRRHGMAGGALTHGGHSKRRVGSIGMKTYPSKVAKNKRMPGHMGNTRITQQNLKVVQIRGDENLLLVKGAVPGAVGALVIVNRALKKAGIAG
jgi:large subunit ribosomal protein L3